MHWEKCSLSKSQVFPKWVRLGVGVTGWTLRNQLWQYNWLACAIRKGHVKSPHSDCPWTFSSTQVGPNLMLPEYNIQNVHSLNAFLKTHSLREQPSGCSGSGALGWDGRERLSMRPAHPPAGWAPPGHLRNIPTCSYPRWMVISGISWICTWICLVHLWSTVQM